MELAWPISSKQRAISWTVVFTLVLAAGCGSVESDNNKLSGKRDADETNPAGQAGNADGGLEVLLDAGIDSIRIERIRLANGLLQILIPARAGELARITLAIKASNLFDPKGKAGIAWLTANSLRESGAGGLDSKGLEESLARIGAELEVATGGAYVYFEAACPEKNLPKLAQILFGVIIQDAPPDQVIEAQRRRISRELEAAADSYKMRWQTFNALGRLLPTPRRLLSELKDVGSAELLLFHKRFYRPQNALLAVQTTQKENSRLVQEIFQNWKKGEALPPLPPDKRPTRSSFEMAPAVDGHVMLILPDPDPTLSGSARHEVAWQLLCMDGNGGIFARKLAAKRLGELDFVRGQIDTGSRRYRSLSANVEPKHIDVVLEAFDEALQELSSEISSKVEFSMARRRAAFAWNDRLSRPASRIRCFIDAELAGQTEQLDRKTLESIAQLDANSVIRKGTGRLHARTIVRGAKPAGATALPQPAKSKFTPEAMTKVEPTVLAKAARQLRAKESMDSAIAILGGKKRLLALRGFAYRSRVETLAAIPFTEAWQLRLPDGPFVRKRRILGTEIVNRTAGDKVKESYGGKTDTLERAAAELFRLEARMHPTMLLSHVLHEKIGVDLIGSLETGDRKLVILEILVFGQKVRIGIDKDNGLIRRLYYSEWRAHAAPQNIMLRFQDYRGAALKLPHRIYKFVDGERRSDVLVEYGK